VRCVEIVNIKSTDIGSVAQRVLFIEGDTSPQVSEEKHQILSSHILVPTAPNTPGVTSAFGPIEQAQTVPMSQPTRPSYDSGLHCARGREALKFRAEGDTSMFFRNSTSATTGPKSAQSSTQNLVASAPMRNRPISAVSGRTTDMVFEEAV